jgi:YegS/Rv2252/BmrU family lipid kinase
MDPRRPFVLVVNPRAAAGRAEARLPEIEGALRRSGGEFETRATRGPRDATRIVREALGEGAPGVAVVGGDGTFSEAACGFFTADGDLSKTDAWFGPIPCGTGGDFSRTLGIRGEPVETAAKLLTVTPRKVDCGWISYIDHDGEPAGRAFLNIASFGVAGLVDQLVNDGPKWVGGTPAFLLGTVRAIVRYRPQHVRVTIDDGKPVESIVTNVAVANGRYFGGGMHVAPTAKIDDGLLDVVTIESMPLLTQGRMMRRMYDGTVLDVAGVRHGRGGRVYAEPVEPGERVLLDIDGEAPGRLPATLVLHPGAISLRASA